ncbi:MAG: hypothetical protein FWD35_05005, partial [Oscillospiraceae bacterium]|nr:hypothetical protein [Oscillospiraceae bacterium]
IISLSPALTELVYEFAEHSRLVGRSSFCDFPASVTNVTAFRTGSGFDAQEIAALTPDLLLLSAPISDKDRETLRREGVATVVLPAPRSLEELGALYELVGVILYGSFTGREEGAAAFELLRKGISDAHSADLGEFVYVTENLALATGDTLESSLLTVFGNNLAQGGIRYVFDVQLLLENQPETVLVNGNITIEQLKAHSVYSQLRAVQQGRVIVINNERFERPSARLLEVVAQVRNS